TSVDTSGARPAQTTSRACAVGMAARGSCTRTTAASNGATGWSPAGATAAAGNSRPPKTDWCGTVNAELLHPGKSARSNDPASRGLVELNGSALVDLSQNDAVSIDEGLSPTAGS